MAVASIMAFHALRTCFDIWRPPAVLFISTLCGVTGFLWTLPLSPVTIPLIGAMMGALFHFCAEEGAFALGRVVAPRIWWIISGALLAGLACASVLVPLLRVLILPLGLACMLPIYLAEARAFRISGGHGSMAPEGEAHVPD
jgi:hypothetical protein